MKVITQTQVLLSEAERRELEQIQNRLGDLRGHSRASGTAYNRAIDKAIFAIHDALKAAGIEEESDLISVTLVFNMNRLERIVPRGITAAGIIADPRVAATLGLPNLFDIEVILNGNKVETCVAIPDRAIIELRTRPQN